MVRVRPMRSKISIYLIIISTTITIMYMFLTNKEGTLKAPETAFTVIRVPLKDTLNKPSANDNISPRKSINDVQRNQIYRGKQESVVGIQRNQAPSDRNKALVQIDKRLLTMIEEIELSDTTIKGNVNVEGKMNFTCPDKLRLVSGVEDLLCMKPPQFLPNYKNPCWNSSEGRFQCLPYFQIIGMDKSGSTDLFDRISKHPDVLKNSGALGKETMWWSWHRYGHWLTHTKKIQPFRQYVNYFDIAAKTIQPQPDNGIITGDGTPMDIWDMSGWKKIPQNQGLKEPKVITPHLIKHINPNVKLLIILRNPVERLFSDYLFLKVGRQTIRAFHEEVIKSITSLHSCTRKYSLRTCLYSRNLHVRSKARIHLGFYSIFLKDWLKVFPREQFLIMKTEDYSNKTKDHLQQAFSFLGLRNLPDSALQMFADATRKYVTKSKKKAGKMYEKTRLILERLYKNYKSELTDILKDKRFMWTESS